MECKFGVTQSPDAKSRSLNLCSKCLTGSHVSLQLEKNEAKSSNRPHSTLKDPNVVENYFKDCFFVSVVIRNMPELHDKPVAVCHSDNPRGTAEISSANYPARSYGIKAGLFVRDAKARCAHLVIVPYNFSAYEEVADQLYGTLHKYCNKVQALSCDEAFLDMTECLHDNPEEVTRRIRSEISDATKCTASTGIAENMLVARLATRSAKPNGRCFIPSEKVLLHEGGTLVVCLNTIRALNAPTWSWADDVRQLFDGLRNYISEKLNGPSPNRVANAVPL